jgi:hypothetical protein
MDLFWDGQWVEHDGQPTPGFVGRGIPRGGVIAIADGACHDGVHRAPIVYQQYHTNRGKLVLWAAPPPSPVYYSVGPLGL